MLISKVYKWRKLIICVVIILGIAFYFLTNSGTGNNTDVVHTYSNLSYIKESKVIDKQMVIESLEKAAKLVTVEGHATKNIHFSDSIFQGDNWLKNTFGKRELDIFVDAVFNTGVDLSQITDNDIVANGNTLMIKLPKHILVSMDAGFDRLIFKERTGIFRSPLNIEQKQMLYSEVRKILEREIVSDKKIEAETLGNVKEALKSLFEKVPNVKYIVFSSKLD